MRQPSGVCMRLYVCACGCTNDSDSVDENTITTLVMNDNNLDG